MANEILAPVQELHTVARSWTGERTAVAHDLGDSDPSRLLDGSGIAQHERLRVAAAVRRIETYCLSRRAGTNLVALRLFLSPSMSSLVLVLGGHNVRLFDALQDSGGGASETVIDTRSISRLEEGFERVHRLGDGSPLETWSVTHQPDETSLVRASGPLQARAWVALRLWATQKAPTWDEAMQAAPEARSQEPAR